MSIGSGIFYGIVRFLLAFVFGVLIGSSLAHLSLETEWLVNLRGHNDIVYKSYLAMVLEYHTNNNPIF